MSGILNCNAEGNPAPRFTWTRTDGKTLNKNRFKQLPTGNMDVIQVQQIDEGEYICTIEQSKGTKQTTSKRQRIDVSLIGKTLKVQLTSLAWTDCRPRNILWRIVHLIKLFIHTHATI